MSLPFGSIENPFAKPIQRSKNTAELIGKILGPAQEMAFREALGSTPDDQNLDITPIVEAEPELTNRERLELTYNLTEQYEKETQTLRDRGLLETNKDGVEFIRGIDGLECPLPSLETIANRLLEQKETLDIKAEQGFTKLILVPFATSLDRQIESLQQFLLNYKKKHPDFDLNEDEPTWVWNDATDGYKDADVKGDLVYGVKEFSKVESEHQGLTKAQILDSQRSTGDPLAGWKVELFQEDIKDRKIIRAGDSRSLGIRSIPRAGEGRVDGKTHPRKEIEAGKSSNEYLAQQLSGEVGQTPEDWICAFIYHLQETGEPLDNYQNGEDSVASLTGAWFKKSGNVPNVYWSAYFAQAGFDRDDPAGSYSGYGSRSVVMV